MNLDYLMTDEFFDDYITKKYLKIDPDMPLKPIPENKPSPPVSNEKKNPTKIYIENVSIRRHIHQYDINKTRRHSIKQYRKINNSKLKKIQSKDEEFRQGVNEIINERNKKSHQGKQEDRIEEIDFEDPVDENN